MHKLIKNGIIQKMSALNLEKGEDVPEPNLGPINSYYFFL